MSAVRIDEMVKQKKNILDKTLILLKIGLIQTNASTDKLVNYVPEFSSWFQLNSYTLT